MEGNRRGSLCALHGGLPCPQCPGWEAMGGLLGMQARAGTLDDLTEVKHNVLFMQECIWLRWVAEKASGLADCRLPGLWRSHSWLALEKGTQTPLPLPVYEQGPECCRGATWDSLVTPSGPWAAPHASVLHVDWQSFCRT